MMRIAGLWLAVVVLSLGSGASASAAPHDTLNNQLVVGFQGWFMCPGDGRAHGGLEPLVFRNSRTPRILALS